MLVFYADVVEAVAAVVAAVLKEHWRAAVAAVG